MEFFDTFPYTELQGKNRALDWVMQKIASFQKEIDKIPEYVAEYQPDETEHAKSRDNPHKVTAEQVGAAPAGYGLGLENGLYLNDCNDAVAFGLFMVGWQTANNPLNTYGALLVLPHNNTEKTQILTSSNTKTILVRHEEGGEWKPWEWENPPMIPNEEYRTTKRHNGEAVYTKLIPYAPSSFNSQLVYLPHSISNMGVGLSISVSWLMVGGAGSERRHFPSIYYGDATAWAGQAFWAGTSEICFEIGTVLREYMTASPEDIQVTVEYTKSAN